jgi:hypothetical protein
MIRTPGFWMAVIMALLQAANAVRAFADPVGFSGYMGLPLASSDDVGFVMVYGLRAAFLACMVALLLVLKRLDVLAWIALIAVIMPVGDAWLAAQAGAPAVTVMRHGLIALYLPLTFIFLRRAAGRHP